MQLSAEFRWFWRDMPRDLDRWFQDATAHGCTPGGGKKRIDRYLRDPRQQELGIKARGGKPRTEIKGLVLQRSSSSGVFPFDGPIQIWAKWSSEAIAVANSSLVDVTKLRHLRKFDTSSSTPREIQLNSDENPVAETLLPSSGCNVEFTAVHVREQAWWTLGFEAFGALDAVERSLVSVATVLSQRQPPAFEPGALQSYPEWLSNM